MENDTSVNFHKFSATGNDFILIDNRQLRLDENDGDFFRRICARRTGVGADGVLLIEGCPEADFRLRYINPDGSETECGNGARSAAYYASHMGITGDRPAFLFGSHPYAAEVRGERVKLKMPSPADSTISPGILEEPDLRGAGFVNNGVPHYIIFSDRVDEIDVCAIGKKYRRHMYFQPGGTNVDFVEIVTGNEIQIRTYERGVEDETLSCGTGCVATALVSHEHNLADFPVTVRARGGVLQVFHENGRYFLEGRVILFMKANSDLSVHKAKALFTIGHSSHSIQNFVDLLASNQIRLLVDVRRVPASGRYPHFNRKTLAANLEMAGIAYQWLGRELGGLREQDYAAYMKTGDFADGLQHIKNTATKYRTAIMCAEADYTQCHRRFIAEMLSRERWSVHHITANGKTIPHQAMLL